MKLNSAWWDESLIRNSQEISRLKRIFERSYYNCANKEISYPILKTFSAPYYIGLDIGTGSVKALAYLKGLEPIYKSQFHYSLSSSKTGYYELDPELVWDGVLSCMKDLLQKMNYLPQSISLSSAMHGLMVMGKKGEIYSPIITWADSRSANIASRLRALPEAEEIYRKTGTPIHSMSPLCKIIWLKENQPEMRINPLVFVSIKSFIWYRLFGVFEEDWSMASATGLMDIESKKWYQPSLRLAGIEENELPILVDTGFFRSQIKSELAISNGFDQGVPIVIGASDGCTASLGSFTLMPGTASITIGTSGAVRICSKRPVYQYPEMIFNYILDKDIWVSGGAINNGGIALDWAMNQFIQDPQQRTYEHAFQKIETIDSGSNGLLFLPYLTGERAPLWNEKASALFIGMTLKHSPNHFLRAVLEGICFSIYQVLLVLEKDAPKIHQIHISGGFTDSPVWVQILADITGKTLILLQENDASTLGAALLAMKALGDIPHLESLQEPKIIREYQPHPEKNAVYKKLFNHYLTLFPIVKKTMEGLSDDQHKVI